MTNDDLKRFYSQNSTPEKSNDFVRYNANGEIPGVGGNGGEHETVIIDALPTATQGTITQEQLATLQKNDANTLLFSDEIYRLSDKRTSEGYLIYSHACQDNTDNFYIKCITITISTLGWVLTSLNIGGKKYQHNIVLNEGNSFKSYFSFINDYKEEYKDYNLLKNDLYKVIGNKKIIATGYYISSTSPNKLYLINYVRCIVTVDGYVAYITAGDTRITFNSIDTNIEETQQSLLTGFSIDTTQTSVDFSGIPTVTDEVIEL